MSRAVSYSEAFKRQVVDEIGRGRYKSTWKAREAYGIGGAETVNAWVKKYGREELLPKRVRIETMKEVDRLKQARKRIRELEAALADAHIDQCLEHAFLEIACEEMGVDLEKFKKNNALTLSDVRRKQGRK